MRRVLSFAATVLMFTTLAGCEFCETRGTITFDNTRLWCNCDIEFPNGDEYVVFAGRPRPTTSSEGHTRFTSIVAPTPMATIGPAASKTTPKTFLSRWIARTRFTLT